MGSRRTLGVASVGCASLHLALLFLAGCAALPPNSLFDPTKVGRFGRDVYETGIRRVLSPRETPPGLPNATEPNADDLVAWADEYRLAPGDVISVTINDLLDQGTPFGVNLEINTQGEIRIPELGSIKVAGMTDAEVEQELRARLIEAGILPEPVVLVFAAARRGRTFSALGAVSAPGTYPITDPDMRVLDALATIGDIAATARYAYIIRRASATAPVSSSAGPSDAPTESPTDLVIPVPIEDEHRDFSSGLGLAAARTLNSDDPPPPTHEDLAEVLTPQSAPAEPPTTRAVQTPGEPDFPPLIFDPQTGQVVRSDVTAAPPEVVTPIETDAVDEEVLDQPFDWDDVEEFALEQRVIEIDVPALKSGNPRYNIVLRSKDVLHVPPDTGVFYMMGEINRPGVYALGGREITIKQAVAVSGGFSVLAWPQRCEIIRREPGTDKELVIPVNLDAIFAGLEDDLFLRDNDIVNIGTHVAAPFLFVLRNSFRFTYGFGFVYDRNFADKDSYGGRTNPETVARQERAQRGLSF